MGIYEMSVAGSVKVPRVNHQSMNAGNQFGAMVPIASANGNGVSGTIAFNNIPQIYQDLMLVMYVRTGNGSTGDAIDGFINGDSSTIYSGTRLLGDGASASSARLTGANVVYGSACPGGTSTAGIFGSAVWHYLNYANTSTYKTIIGRSASDLNGSGQTRLFTVLYRSTNAITSLSVFPDSGSYMATGSTFTLYGIRAVSS